MAAAASAAAYSRADVERMVSDAVRSRTGGSSSTMSTDDRVRTFVSELKTLVAKCFGDLNSMVKEKFSGSAEQLERFGRGLSVIENWDAGVRAEETQRALARFPYIADEYKYTVITFVRSLVHDDESHKVRIPPFDMFLFYYFREVARSPVMRHGSFFFMGYLEQDAFLRDTLHVVLRDCAQLLKTTTTTSSSSRVSGGNSSCVSSTASVHPAWRAALSPPHAQHTHVIQPADSVSNIGQRQASRASAAMSQQQHQSHQQPQHHQSQPQPHQSQQPQQPRTSVAAEKSQHRTSVPAEKLQHRTSVSAEKSSVHPSDSVSNVGGRGDAAVPRVAQEITRAAPQVVAKTPPSEDKVVDTSVVGTNHVEQQQRQSGSASASVASMRFFESDQSGSDFDEDTEDDDKDYDNE